MSANGGKFKTLFWNGQLHLRSNLGKPLIAPVTLPSGANPQCGEFSTVPLAQCERAQKQSQRWEFASAPSAYIALNGDLCR